MSGQATLGRRASMERDQPGRPAGGVFGASGTRRGPEVGPPGPSRRTTSVSIRVASTKWRFRSRLRVVGMHDGLAGQRDTVWHDHHTSDLPQEALPVVGTDRNDSAAADSVRSATGTMATVPDGIR